LVNYPDNSSKEQILKHQQIFKELSFWSEKHSTSQLQFYPIIQPLPAKTAGAGLARKLAMDEAIHRFEELDKPDGIIVSLDADCTCDSNYLEEISKYYKTNKNKAGSSVYFEHNLSGNEYPQSVYNAIVKYELYLRYYIEGLRYTGYPHAYHTIGSAFTVTAQAYCKVGGMNKRQGGEDFYFLQKIMMHGNYGEINTTCVRPSPRPSHRAPFGTGAEINKMLNNINEPYFTYNPKAFDDLKMLFLRIDGLFKKDKDDISDNQQKLPESFRGFPKMDEFVDVILEANKNATTLDAFRKRFFRWFDGLMCLRFLNYAHETQKTFPECI
jgi:hypothetical protein